jgi:hypothetical protein
MKGIHALQSHASDTEPGIIRNAFFRLYINYGEDCLKHGERREAVQLFLKAWRYKPTSIVPFKKAARSMFSTFKNAR